MPRAGDWRASWRRVVARRRGATTVSYRGRSAAAGVVHRADDVFFWGVGLRASKGWRRFQQRAAAACAELLVDERRRPLWAFLELPGVLLWTDGAAPLRLGRLSLMTPRPAAAARRRPPRRGRTRGRRGRAAAPARAPRPPRAGGGPARFGVVVGPSPSADGRAPSGVGRRRSRASGPSLEVRASFSTRSRSMRCSRSISRYMPSRSAVESWVLRFLGGGSLSSLRCRRSTGGCRGCPARCPGLRLEAAAVLEVAVRCGARGAPASRAWARVRGSLSRSRNVASLSSSGSAGGGPGSLSAPSGFSSGGSEDAHAGLLHRLGVVLALRRVARPRPSRRLALLVGLLLLSFIAAALLVEGPPKVCLLLAAPAARASRPGARRGPAWTCCGRRAATASPPRG